MSENEELRFTELETSVLYIMSITMDLILRDCERRMARHSTIFRHEKKRKFTDYIQTVKRACLINDDLSQDIYKATEKTNFQDLDLWLSDGNDLARLVLLYGDRSSTVGVLDKLFELLQEAPGEGIVKEEFLKNFYLK